MASGVVGEVQNDVARKRSLIRYALAEHVHTCNHTIKIVQVCNAS